MLTADGRSGREEQLILDLARSRIVPRAGREAPIEVGGVDWEWLVGFARAHGVLPLVRRALSEGAVPSLGSEARAIVDGAADAGARHSLLMTSKLLQLLAQLSSAGVTAVPWKGPVLAAMLWSDVAMRQYADLDVLVRRADLERARDVLLGAGFRRVVPLSPWQEPRYIARNGTLEMIRESDGLVVEIGWTMVPNHYSSAMDADGIWDRLEEIEIARRTVRTLAPEDVLVALSIHGFKHRWERLGWIVDVARLIQVRPGIDWAAIRERTRRDGSQRLVRIAAGIAGAMLYPAVAAEALRVLGPDAKAERIVDELRPAVLRRVPDGHVINASALHLRARERGRDRIAYALRGLTTSTVGDWRAFGVPPRMSGLYGIVRPVRLLARYLNRVRRGA